MLVSQNHLACVSHVFDLLVEVLMSSVSLTLPVRVIAYGVLLIIMQGVWCYICRDVAPSVACALHTRNVPVCMVEKVELSHARRRLQR